MRFIYVRPADWYLSYRVEQKRDVIEYPIVDEIDCGGWDVRKALYLFSRTNGALLEWLKSPVRYIEAGPLAAGLRALEVKAVNRTALCYHYSHMARSNAREYLFDSKVKLKKYLYVLRPLLSIRFIEAEDRAPPIEFQALVDAVAPQRSARRSQTSSTRSGTRPSSASAIRSRRSTRSSNPRPRGTATGSRVKAVPTSSTSERSRRSSIACSARR